MFDAALRMEAACGGAIGAGLAVHIALPRFLSGMNFDIVLLRSGLLCIVGLGAYSGFAWLLRVKELAEVRGMIGRAMKLRKDDQGAACKRA
jgi:hypothetical protein